MNICEEVISRRSFGRVICEIFNASERESRAEALQRFDYRNLSNDQWIRADREEAKNVLTHCLSRDLAYDAEIMDVNEARSLATAFVESFPPEAFFMTNSQAYLGADLVRNGIEWSPLSSATFDTGIIAETDVVLGMLWVEDED